MRTPADRVALARQAKDYTANDLVRSTNPLLAGRCGSFAVLPMRDDSPADITNAIAESIRPIETLGMDGVGTLGNYAGAYPGDPRFDPLMAALDALGAVVLLQPVTPVAFPNLGLPTFLYEFVFDTTRAVVNMLYKQVLTRYPNIKWVVAHAGGTIPFLSYRTSLLSTQNPVVGQNVGIGPDDVVKEYAKLYYDTALSPTPAAQRSVREVTGLKHVLFATDYPFDGPVFLKPGDPAPQLSDTYTPPSGASWSATTRCSCSRRSPRAWRPPAPRRRREQPRQVMRPGRLVAEEQR